MDSWSIVTDRLRGVGRITALTGAGVSAASGVPTFRGPNGLWRDVPATLLADPATFEQDPKLVWEWYDWRRQVLHSARPNPAHEVLARWTRSRPDFTLVTQNVDGLDDKAGADRVLRLHGSIWHVRCSHPCQAGKADWRDATVPFESLPPRCPHCGAHVRPAVVWFGEALDPRVVAAADEATRCDVFLAIGTSAVVYPAAGFIRRARQRGAFTVEINPENTDASASVDVAIRGSAADVLTELDARIGAPSGV